MQTSNAKFKSIAYWKDHQCTSLEDMLDFARCLEDIAFKVMPNWRVFGGADDAPRPSLATMQASPQWNLTAINAELPHKTGWMAAEMPLPLLAEMVPSSEWGKWHLQFSGDYDPDIYCDDTLVASYFFRVADLDVCDSRGVDDRPWIYVKIPSPQTRPIGNIIARSGFSGLKQYSALIRDMAQSLRAGAQLLSTVNRRDNLYVQGEVDINNSKLGPTERAQLSESLYAAANAVCLAAAARKDLKAFVASLEDCKKRLAPLAEYAKRFTIHLIGHSHIDLAWKWRWPESIACMKGTLEDQLELMKREKDFVFVESSPAVWKALDEQHPETWKQCRAAAERGQLEPVGAMWCEPDGQCLGAESWVRQIMHGQNAALQYFGRESRCGFNIDAFGYNAALPKIYKDAGVENFITQKLRYNEFTIFPYIHFWWEADDGSRIFALHAYPDHYNMVDPDSLPATVRIFHNTDGVYNIPILFGFGNHGGGPQPQMFDRAEHVRTLSVFPNVRYTSCGDYFDLIKREEADTVAKLPVIKDELFLETHHKTYTVQGKTKEADRECERRLLAAEALWAIALDHGSTLGGDLLHGAWRVEMFNQFHDILTGTSFPSVYQDVFDDYRRAYDQIAAIQSRLCAAILGEGTTRYVFNQLPWSHNAVVKLPADSFAQCGTLVDSRGIRTAYQKSADGTEIVFIAKSLPGLGFETYRPAAEATPPETILKSGSDWVENGHLTIRFDSAQGIIRSLVIDNKQLAGAGIGRLNLLEDTRFRDYQTWNMGLTGKEWNPKCVSFERIESGPVRVVFRAKYTFGLWEKKKPYFTIGLWHTPGVDYPTSFFTQDFVIYQENNRVECVLNTDWWEDQIVLKVAADTTLTATRAHYQIPFGAIERPTKRETLWEKARFEVPANNWADLTGQGLGLAILNRSRHGYDALGGRLRLTLLTSPWGENRSLVSDPLADRGRHTIQYAFYPHRGDYKAARMQRLSCEYEYPPLVLSGGDQPRVAPGESFLEVDPDKFVVVAVKPAEDGKGTIVRGYEPYGNNVELSFAGKLGSRNWQRNNIIERAVGATSGGIASTPLSVKAHAIATLRFT